MLLSLQVCFRLCYVVLRDELETECCDPLPSSRVRAAFCLACGSDSIVLVATGRAFRAQGICCEDLSWELRTRDGDAGRCGYGGGWRTHRMMRRNGKNVGQTTLFRVACSASTRVRRRWRAFFADSWLISNRKAYLAARPKIAVPPQLLAPLPCFPV